jgi:hypothetical protein
MSEEELSSATSESSVDDTPSEHGSEPTHEEQTDSIAITTQWLDDLHLGSNMSGRSAVGAPTNGNGGTKVNPPMEFTGRRDQIKSFRLQCKLYWEMNPERFNNNARAKLLFAMSYLRGKALEWIQPHMENYIDSTSTDQVTETTRAVLGSVDLFFAAIKETFDVGNDTLEADRDLRALRQRTSAAAYRAEFSILAAKVGWNDDALASQFYRGLKDQVRTEITMHHVRPSTLKDMADLAIQIDSRIFEVQMEKKGSYFQGKPNTKVQRDVPAWKDNYYGLQKMQIDATQGKPGSNHNNGSKNKSNKRPQPKTKGTTDKSSVECYGCGKKGHYKSECNARKQRHDLQGSGQHKSQDNSFRATKSSDKEVVETPRVETLKATQGRGGYQEMEPMTTQDPHGMESWTACFDDNCAIHMSDKFGSGYWPAKKTRSVCRAIGGPGQIVRYTAGYPPQEESSTEEGESSEEEGELRENSEPESPGELEECRTTEFTRVVPVDDAILPVLNMVWDAQGLILPWDGDGTRQMVNERELWILIGKIRTALWKMPHEKHGTDYTKIVQEHPPLGSTFTSNASYTTVEGVIFSPELRSRLRLVKAAFCEEAATQASNGGAQYSSGSVDLYTLPQRLEPPQMAFEEPEEVRRQPLIRQNRPPTPYTSERSVWEPPLNTSDPNYVPRRPISMQGTQAGGSRDPRRQVILGRTSRQATGN